jgi:hypothetical protein
MKQSNSPVGYGSEFHPPSKNLEPILSLHPNWPHFCHLLLEGSDGQSIILPKKPVKQMGAVLNADLL